jgi:hypothetical protein
MIVVVYYFFQQVSDYFLIDTHLSKKCFTDNRASVRLYISNDFLQNERICGSCFHIPSHQQLHFRHRRVSSHVHG